MQVVACPLVSLFLTFKPYTATSLGEIKAHIPGAADGNTVPTKLGYNVPSKSSLRNYCNVEAFTQVQ